MKLIIMKSFQFYYFYILQHMKHKQNLILIFLILLGFSCSVNKKASELKNTYIIPNKYETYLTQQKKNILLLSNSNKTTPLMPIKILQLVIIDTDTEEIIFEDEIREGSYDWVNDDFIKVTYTPGNPQTNTDYFYYFNIKTRKKVNNYKTLQFK